MRRAGRVIVAGAMIALFGIAGYAVADGMDTVPGFITFTDPAKTTGQRGERELPVLAVPEKQGQLLPAFNKDALRPTAEQLRPLIARYLTPDKVGTTLSYEYRDVATGEVIVASGEYPTPLIPASSLKVLTGAAAMATLDPRDTLSTTVTRQPDSDLITLIGGGDVLLAPGKGDPDAIAGRAGLGDLAAQVAGELKKTKTSAVRVQVDTSLFSGPTLREEWGSDEVDGHVAHIQSLGVLAGAYAPPEGRILNPDPAAQAGQLFVDALRADGIDASLAAEQGTSDRGAVEIGKIHSAPIEDVIVHTLRTSDNTVAEVLGRLVAIKLGKKGSFDGAVAAVPEALGKLGYEPTGLVMRDCSGLSFQDHVSPGLISQILTDAYTSKVEILGALPRSLAVGGADGTLSNRFDVAPVAGNVRAKTGSLTGVNTLSGYVQTSSGRLVAYSLFVNGTDRATTPAGEPQPISALDVMKALDDLTTAVALL